MGELRAIGELWGWPEKYEKLLHKDQEGVALFHGWVNDQSIAILQIPENREEGRSNLVRCGGWIVLTWYKSRGTTEDARKVEGFEPITLDDAERAIELFAPYTND